jgi:hypothetical protein
VASRPAISGLPGVPPLVFLGGAIAGFVVPVRRAWLSPGPSDAPGLADLGTGLSRTRPRLAFAGFDEALRIDQAYARAVHERASLLGEPGEGGDHWLAFPDAPRPSIEGLKDQTIADLTEAIRLEPGSAAAYRLRGGLLFSPIRRDDAEGRAGDFRTRRSPT